MFAQRKFRYDLLYALPGECALAGYRFVKKNEVLTNECQWYNELIRNVPNRLIPITSDGLIGQMNCVNEDNYPLYFSDIGGHRTGPGADSYQAGFVIKIA